MAAVTGGVVGAAAVAIQISGLSGATAIAPTPGVTSARISAAAEEEILATTARGRGLATQGRYAEAWKRFGLRQLKAAIKNDFECAAFSTDQIRDSFLFRTQCLSMTRRLEPLIDDQGKLAVVSIAWVRMPGIEAAIQLQDLANDGRNGWVVALNGDLIGHPEIHFNGERRVVSRQSSVVKFADSVPLSAVADPKVLAALSDVAVEFPDPDP